MAACRRLGRGIFGAKRKCGMVKAWRWHWRRAWGTRMARIGAHQWPGGRAPASSAQHVLAKPGAGVSCGGREQLQSYLAWPARSLFLRVMWWRLNKINGMALARARYAPCADWLDV